MLRTCEHVSRQCRLWSFFQCALDLRGSVKALANEDTLLRTHCCPWCFLGCANWETFVTEQDVSEQRHKICVRNKCFARGQTGKHLCRQQCVRNNVSSFATAFRFFRVEFWGWVVLYSIVLSSMMLFSLTFVRVHDELVYFMFTNTSA